MGNPDDDNESDISKEYDDEVDLFPAEISNEIDEVRSLRDMRI
jgi:hypothetical protein